MITLEGRGRTGAMLLVVAFVSVVAFQARAACTPITTLPATIAQSGSYCLTADVSAFFTGQTAIFITADNVTIDLDGHEIRKRAQTPETPGGGVAALGRSNVTVRNGTLRGFSDAISLTGAGSRWSLIEGIRAIGSRQDAIVVEGPGSIVRNNWVMQTGGTTLLPYASGGINVMGEGARVLENDIVDVHGSGGVTGVGIYVEGPGAQVIGNRITSANVGVRFAASDGSKYRDNLTTEVVTPFIGGVDAGGNN